MTGIIGLCPAQEFQHFGVERIDAKWVGYSRDQAVRGDASQWPQESPEAPKRRRPAGQRGDRESRGLLGGACGVWEQLSAPAAPAAECLLTCDRCDGAHMTDQCPHFSAARDRHADAWQHFSGAVAAGSIAKAIRHCIAPRDLSSQFVRTVRMPGDGTCLFHSIAYGLSPIGFRNEDGHSIRQRVANFIAQNPEFEITGTPLRSWIDWDSHMNIASYASRLASGDLWGGAIEMAACAQIFEVDVAVYEEDYWRGDFRRISDFLTDGKPRGAVLVLYSGRSHYDALQDVSGGRSHGERLTYGGEVREYRPGLGKYYRDGASEDDDWLSACSLM